MALVPCGDAQALNGRRRRAATSLLCAVAAVVGTGVAAFTLGTAPRTPGPQGLARRCSAARTARSAEAFDPFGWKGKFKDTVQGLLDGLADDDEPSKLEEQMILEIFEKFDVDKDRVLNLEEFNNLQVATEGEGAIYNKDQLVDLLLAVNPEIQEPERGMPFEDYRRLYVGRRLRQTYSTDVSRDHVKIFGPGGGVAAAAAVEGAAAEGAAVGDGAEEGLLEGSAVVIEGLAKAVELNGSEGHIVAPVESEAALVADGRVIVKLADGERVALKKANVKATR